MYFPGCVLLVGLWMVLYPGILGLIMALFLLATGAAVKRLSGKKSFLILLHCFVYTQAVSVLLRMLIFPEIRYYNSLFLFSVLLTVLGICLGIITQSYVVGGLEGNPEYGRRSLWWLFELTGVCIGLAITSWIQLPSQLSEVWRLGIVLVPWVCADELVFRLRTSPSGFDLDWKQLLRAMGVVLASFITFLAVGIGKYVFLTSQVWYYSLVVDMDVPSAWAHFVGDLLALAIVILFARKFARKTLG